MSDNNGAGRKIIAADLERMERIERTGSMVDLERLVGLEFIRATEAAALSAYKWMGKGDKDAADYAACDAICGLFDTVNVSGEVTIGEGIKDNAPGIFKGEKLGTWTEGSI